MIFITNFLIIFGYLIPKIFASLSICSSQNTGSTGSSYYDLYQSNGWCENKCNGFAFGIVQGSNCWCSNVQPGDTTNINDCNEDCPGFPSDKCGNKEKGLFGYIQLGTASSTDDGESSSTSSTSISSTSSTSTSSTSTTSKSSTSSTSSSSTSPTTTTLSSSSSSDTSSSDTSTTTSSSSSSSSSNIEQTTSSSIQESSTISSTSSSSSQQTTSSITSSAKPQISIVYSVKTITGSARTDVATTQIVSTVTNIPSSIPSANSEASQSSTNNNNNNNNSNSHDDGSQNKSKDGFFDSTGKVAGTFTAVGVVVVTLLSTLLYCCCFRKRSSNDDDDDGDDEMKGVQDHSGMILDDDSAHSYRDEKYMDPGAEGQGEGMLHPDDSFVEVDQRLDPRQMFMNWENGSRKSLADELDYSRRVLRVTNE